MDWLRYFWSGAVHVEDLAQAVLCSLGTVRVPLAHGHPALFRFLLLAKKLKGRKLSCCRLTPLVHGHSAIFRSEAAGRV